MKRLATLAFALLTTIALAQAITPEAAITRFMTQPVQAEWFTPAVLNAAPLTQLQAIVTQLKAQLGEFKSVTLRDASRFLYGLTFEKGSVPVTVQLDDQGRIAAFVFTGPPQMNQTSLGAALEPFRTLSGKVSVLVLEGSTERASLNPDAPLAVGSAFKLAILAALQDQVKAGKRSWADVVTLTDDARSLPSGILQTWPTGTPLTVGTLATLMISQSDNTATDVLLKLAGREAAEAYAPRNKPLLSTREAFALKNAANASLLARWRAGNETARRVLLPELAGKPLPNESAFAGGPIAPDVEWFFTARELCALATRVSDLPLTGVNPGLADPAQWARVTFKGGSEPGVLNFTTVLTGKDGRQWCVVTTWNDDKVLDDTKFALLYTGLLSNLK